MKLRKKTKSFALALRRRARAATLLIALLCLPLWGLGGQAWAQETLTVFDGNGTSEHIPMCGYFFDNYTKSECIIPASELTAMKGGTITAITFYAKTVAGSNPTFGTANQKVFLKEVSETTLGSYSGMTGATVVFDGLLPMPTTSASGYTITFSQGYTYNGGNLLIGVYNDAKDLYNKVEWYGNNNQSDRVSAYGYSTSSLASVSYEKQNFLPKTTFTYTTPDPNAGLLTGRFSVSATKQVRFSQGNLQAYFASAGTSCTWRFATNQYDYVGSAAANVSINGNGSVSAAGAVDLFGWVGNSSTVLTGTPAKYGISNSTTASDYGTSTSDALKDDWGNLTITANGSATNLGWRTLTSAEWVYLFNTRTSGSTVNGTSNARFTHATINTDGTSVNGVILFPDGVTIANGEATSWGNVNSNSTWSGSTKCTSAQWTALAAKGCVFLPAAGRRRGATVYGLPGSEPNVPFGYYWSSSPNASDQTKADHMYFYSDRVYPGNTGLRYDCMSVRLVKNYIFTGLGTQASPYLIASTTDWDNLVTAVNGGETYSGKYFKMTANVGDVTPVSTWMTGTFSGTFDGDGKTLTVGYSNTTADVMCAPFGTLNGATIQNLKVAGSISSNQKFIAGIAAWCSSTGNNVTNCLVSATINSSYSGNAADGGLVSLVDNGASLNVTGCAFAGKMLTTNGTASCGGIVGWRRPSGTATITNCLYAPTSATGSETWIESAEGENGNANFCRWNSSKPTITNCYYTTDFGSGDYTAQGIQARTIAAGDYVSTLSVTKGSATATYTVSGITVYSGGIDFNDGSTTTFYGGSGQTVSLALTAETRSGYQFKQYAASQGTLSGQTTDAPTLTMPAASGETLYTTYTATAGPDGVSDKSGYAKLVDNDKSTKVCATFTSGVYIDFNTPNAIVPTGYVITTANDASSEYWRNRSPKTWKLYGKLNEGDSWTVLDDVADGNLPNEDTTDKSYSIANTAAYKYFRYEISAIKGSTELFQLAELQLKGYDAVVISAEYDPTYNATFADGIDNDGWSIDPTQQIAGGTVTVSYTGENKVKSVTVAPKGALTGKFSVSSTKQVQFSKGNLQYVGTWQFAANQYDIFGESQSDDHRDLFGWGTKTNPNETSTTNGDYSWAEWGENTITNGCTGWRTLTKDEWGYLFSDRANASTLRTFATVNSVTGLIVMPDGWTASGVTLTITTANYTTNVLSTSQWATLEKQGCVFLPAAGGRAGTEVVNVGSIGDYWSSDASGDTNAYDLNFSSNNYLLPQNTAGQRHYGWSVRLVRDVTVTKLALCSLSEVTSEHVGKIIGADGNVYASLAQAEKVTTAVGILGKVTETGHGLIMSLEDAPQQVWATIDGWASASYAGTTLKVLPDDDARGSNLPSYTTLGSTTVSNWAVATRADYTAIFTNLGSTGGDSDGISYDANMNAKITGAGGTAISGQNWSSTQYDSSKAWRFASTWGGRNKTDQYKVRPVLGF